jgi:hypothetical protein
MAISTSCSHCQRPLRLADHLAGKRIRCPKCQHIIAVPGAEELLPTAAVLEDTESPHDELSDEDRPDRTGTKVRSKRTKHRPVQTPRSTGFYVAVGVCVGVLVIVILTLGIGVWLATRDSWTTNVADLQAASDKIEQGKTNIASQNAKVEPPPKSKMKPVETWKEPGQFRVYPYKGWGFSIVPPKGWQAERGPKNPFMILWGPQGKFSQHAEIAKEDHDGTPIDKLGAREKQHLPTLLKDWRFGEESQLKVDGRDTYAITGRAILTNGPESYDLTLMRYYYIRDEQTLYVLTIWVFPETYEKRRGEFEQAAKSVIFESPDKGVELRKG